MLVLGLYLFHGIGYPLLYGYIIVVACYPPVVYETLLGPTRDRPHGDGGMSFPKRAWTEDGEREPRCPRTPHDSGGGVS